MADTTRPEPVLDAAKLAGAIILVVGAVVTLLIAFGVNIDDNQKEAITVTVSAVLTLVAAVTPYLAALKARNKVTPLSSPQTAQGVALVPASGTQGVTR